LGSNGITGGGIPIGTGAALSAQMQGNDQVVVIFFGDGAANQGTFHESLNLAAIWRLPAVYVCENNLYAMSTSIRDVCPIENISDRAAAYGMPGVHVDGMDVLAVASAVRTATDRARSGRGPSLIECKTYRFLGHSKSDQRLSRHKDEEAAWRERDPVARFRQTMLEQGLASAADLDGVARDALATVEAAVEFARNSAFPDLQALTDGVFADMHDA